MENNTGSCKKIPISKWHLAIIFFPGWFADCRQLCQFPFVVKYSIWTRGGRHHKVPNEPQTFDPFTEWLNFMFKYRN